mmetsp:Transcript_19828/g.79046  ORF Transcript_19828/g.79046 Transcript_19828/m.79046 type:complete len:653 (-) Transcript_19828:1653-3611(-)
MLKILHNAFSFEYSDIRVLTDVVMDEDGAQCYESVRPPTAGNIVKGMEWLTASSTGQSRLFFYFSGHGVQAKDHTGEEDDGLNECLVASDDYFISDDTIRAILVNRVPLGARLACMVDSCHSGNCADLTYYVRLRDIYDGGDSPSVRKYPTQIQGSTEVHNRPQQVTMPSKEYPALGQQPHTVASGYKAGNPKYPLQSQSQGTGAYAPQMQNGNYSQPGHVVPTPGAGYSARSANPLYPTQAPSGGYAGFYGNANQALSGTYPLQQQPYQTSQYGASLGQNPHHGQQPPPAYPPPPQPYNSGYCPAPPNDGHPSYGHPSYGSSYWPQPSPNPQHSTTPHTPGYSQPFGGEGQGLPAVPGSSTEIAADHPTQLPGDYQRGQRGEQQSHENPGDAFSPTTAATKTTALLEENAPDAQRPPGERKDEPVSTITAQKARDSPDQGAAPNTRYASSQFPTQTQSCAYPTRGASLDPGVGLLSTFDSLNLGSGMNAPDALNRGYSQGHGQPPPAVMMQPKSQYGFQTPVAGLHTGIGLRPHPLPTVQLNNGEISQFSTSVEGRPSYGGMVILLSSNDDGEQAAGLRSAGSAFTNGFFNVVRRSHPKDYSFRSLLVDIANEVHALGIQQKPIMCMNDMSALTMSFFDFCRCRPSPAPLQ